MKRNVFLLMMLAVVLAFSMAVVGCSNGSTGSGDGNGDKTPKGIELAGTAWSDGKEDINTIYSFTSDSEGDCTVWDNSNPPYTTRIYSDFTYTVSGDTVTMTFTTGSKGVETGTVSGDTLTVNGVAYTKVDLDDE